jgi:hypothetical protein
MPDFKALSSRIAIAPILLLASFFLMAEVFGQSTTLSISGDNYLKRELNKKDFKSLRVVKKILKKSRKNVRVLRNWEISLSDSVFRFVLFPTDADYEKFGDTVFKHFYTITSAEATVSKEGKERYVWYSAKNNCKACGDEVAILRYEITEMAFLVGKGEVEDKQGYIVLARYNREKKRELIRFDF